MDAQSFLMGSSNPGFSFRVPGDRVVGQILAPPTVQQQKVFKTNDPAFWPSGDPKLQMLVSVQTGFRNWEGVATPDPARPDDGARTIYVKGKHFEPAMKRAVLEAGAKFLTVGGWVDITFTGEDMESDAGQKPKLFAVRYMPPPPGSAPVGPAATQAPTSPQQPALQPSYPQQQYATGGHIAAPNYQAQAHTSNPWGATPAAAPRPPVQAQPVWYPQHAPVGYADPAPVSPPPMPAHHEQGPPPGWAMGSPVASGSPAAPSAQVSPAPAMSTLAAIRASQAGPTYGADQPPF